jgi:hypothetical protein
MHTSIYISILVLLEKLRKATADEAKGFRKCLMNECVMGIQNMYNNSRKDKAHKRAGSSCAGCRKRIANLTRMRCLGRRPSRRQSAKRSYTPAWSAAGATGKLPPCRLTALHAAPCGCLAQVATPAALLWHLAFHLQGQQTCLSQTRSMRPATLHQPALELQSAQIECWLRGWPLV